MSMSAATRRFLLGIGIICLAGIAPARRNARRSDEGASRSGLMPPAPTEVFLKPSEPASVENVQFPTDTTVGGVVVLDVALTDTGQEAEVGALRDTPPFTAAATLAIQSWKFKAASLGDMSVPSAMTVVFVYRPPVSIWDPPPFSAALPNPSSSTNAILPAGVVSLAYAGYPVKSTQSGAVIVQLSLDTSGKIQGTKILHGMEGFDSLALAAAKDWKFQAAQYQGEPVRSNVVIVFVFAVPVVLP